MVRALYLAPQLVLDLVADFNRENFEVKIMYARKWIVRLLAVTILAGIPIVKADLVQSQTNTNQSDLTGTNIYSAPPHFGFSSGGTSSSGGTASATGSGGITPTQISNQASSISQQLNQAIDQLTASEAAPKGPRHFARVDDEECINPAAEELSETIQEAQNFINQVNQVNQTQTDNVNRSSW
jgi:hypothetical protein